jgi:hypothetical protein
MPGPVLAHLSPDALPVPTWLLAYGTGFGVVLAFLVLRTTWLRPRLRRAARGAPLPGFVQTAAGPVGFVVRTIGVLAYALVLATALFGVDSDASNLAPYATHITFWFGLLLASAVVGDLWRALNPFPVLAAAVFGRRVPDTTTRPSPGLWPAGLAVGSYLWLQLAYHSPYSPRAVAVWLVAVSAGAMIGAAFWGRAWLRDDEGFARFFGLVALVGPVHRDVVTGRLAVRWPFAGLAGVSARPGTELLLLAVVGSIAFDGVNNMNWWIVEVMGDRSGWARTFVSTAGLVFFVGVAAFVWFGAARLSANAAGADHAPALVPVVAGYAIAHYIGQLVFNTYNVIALLSDPFGRGWDVLGTIETQPHALAAGTKAWIGIGAIALTHLAAALLVHDRSLEQHRALREAARSARPYVGALVVSAVVGVLVVAGG